MSKQELLGEVKKLITIGKEKGFLTYDVIAPCLLKSCHRISLVASWRCSVKWISKS